MVQRILYAAGCLIGSGILLLHLGVALGVVRNRCRDVKLFARGANGSATARGGAPRATVVVVAKDEEAVLPGLLESLERQRTREFEIVLVDDRSSDRTREIMDAFGRRSLRTVKVLSNDVEPLGVTGKVQALDMAVAASSGEVLMFTDSDCTLPPTWVDGHLAYYADPHVGAVFGPIDMPPGTTFLEAYQAFDQRLIHQYSSGSAGLGVPTGCFGNNLSVRRQAVQDVGGFRGLGYTVTEDAALIAAVGKSRGARVLASTLAEITIRTRPQPSWREFVNQHTRWNIGGFYSVDFATRATYRFLVLYLAASMLAAPFGIAAPPILLFTLNAFVSIGILAALESAVYPVRSRRDRLLAMPYTFVFLFFYAYVTLRAVFRRRPEWKGTTLKVKG